MTSITFAITYHNEGEMLNELVDAVLGQEQPPEQILIYDDCSSLRPAGLPGVSRIKVVRGETNVGPAAGRNRLLALCQTEYIHFHDADDSINPGWAAAVRKAIVETGADCVFTELLAIRGGVVQGWNQGLSRLGTTHDLLGISIDGGLLVPTGTFRASLVRQVGGYPDFWQSEDYAFHIELALTKPTYVVVSAPLVVVRQRAESRSNATAEVYRDVVSILTSRKERIPRKYWPLMGKHLAAAGRQLYLSGAKSDARGAFAAAEAFSLNAYDATPSHYRIMAKQFGGYRTEQAATVFRAIKAGLTRRGAGRRL